MAQAVASALRSRFVQQGVQHDGPGEVRHAVAANRGHNVHGPLQGPQPNRDGLPPYPAPETAKSPVRSNGRGSRCGDQYAT